MLALVVRLFFATPLFANPANLTVNAAIPINTFIPAHVFGVNLMPYISPSIYQAVQPKLQAAGAFFVRFPSGIADDYHWNSAGTTDPLGHWVPSNTTFQPGFGGRATYRGSTSPYGHASLAMDGDVTTQWLSNTDTDAPQGQWVYVDLGAVKTADALGVTWGAAYATSFTVQVWDPSAANQWCPYLDSASHWVNTTAVGVAGSAGSQSVSFTAVSGRYFRLLLTASSVSPAQYGVAEFTVSGGGAQWTRNRSTVTNNSPDQTWVVASSMDPACSLDNFNPFDFEKFMAYLAGLGPAAQPLITVNLGGGTPAEAAAWVHYANVVKGYHIVHWEVGNEMNGNWEAGGPLSARDYARRYLEFYQAMKAEDPSISVGGPVAGDPYIASNDFDNKTYIQGFIDRLAADPGGSKTALLDALIFHWYPYVAGNNPPLEFATAARWGTLATDLPAWMAAVPGAATLPVINSEYSSSGGTSGFSVTYANGLWLLLTQGEFLAHFGSRGWASYWTAAHPASATTDPLGGDQSWFQADAGPYQYQEHSGYWAQWLMAAIWARPGDGAVNTLVQTSSDQSALRAYADLRPDGTLALAVANTDPGLTFTANVTLAGYTPAPTAARWIWDPSHYAWTTAALPYHASPDTAPSAGTEPGVGPIFGHSFGPYSITIFEFVPAGFSASPTVTPTPWATATPSPTAGPRLLLDDLEDPSRDSPPLRQNLWGGTWKSFVAPGVAQTLVYSGPGAAGTGRGLVWSLTVPATGWASLETSLPAPFDATGQGYAGVEFWAFGDGKTWRAMIETQGVSDYDYYGAYFAPPPGVWTLERLSFTAMTRAGWGTQSPAPPVVPAASDLTGLEFAATGSGIIRIAVDQVGFYQPAALYTVTPSPTPSPTQSPGQGPVPDGRLIKAMLVPTPLGPGLGRMFCQSEGDPGSVELALYSMAGTAVVRQDLVPAGGWRDGWNQVSVPALVALPNGVYEARLTSKRSRVLSKVVVLR